MSEMSEDPNPKIHLTDLQWEILHTQERRRTEIQAAHVRDSARFQQDILAKLTEAMPPKFSERDMFASSAIGALLSIENSPYLTLCTAGAQKAYEIADAMLKASASHAATQPQAPAGREAE